MVGITRMAYGQTPPKSVPKKTIDVVDSCQRLCNSAELDYKELSAPRQYNFCGPAAADKMQAEQNIALRLMLRLEPILKSGFLFSAKKGEFRAERSVSIYA